MNPQNAEDSQPKRLWAELRRGPIVLLIPEPAWLRLWLESAAQSGEEPFWDEGAGTWLVSAGTAETLAVAARTMASSEFRTTVAHFEGMFVSGTKAAAALTIEAASKVREELVTFLRDGSFSWRIVSL